MAEVADPGRGWRVLKVFWLLVLILVGTGVATLQVMGPPAQVAAHVEPPAPPPGVHALAPGAPPLPEGRIAPPDSALLEAVRGQAGAMLPRVAADGRMARVVYARRFDAADTRPRIGLVLSGAGLSDADTRAAIDALPGPVTLAFSPYSATPEPLLEAARAKGHEILASIPMEAAGFPLNDAGSHSLLTGGEPAANRRNLDWALSREQGYVGATGASDGLRGERYADMTAAMGAMLEEIGRRGLLYIDPRPGKSPPAMLPLRVVDVVVDDPPARAEIEGKLAGLERLARERGSALGLAGPLRPVTIERIAAWANGLEERGFVLAPVSALVSKPAGAAH